MRIGLRTIKTVITATLGIMIASYLGLKYPSTAGIIAILSVTNTKKSSFKVGIGRIVALLAAIVIAFVCYQLLGYRPVAFGLYLLIYIPLAAKANMSEAIPVNSVLMTHFLNEQSMTISLVENTMYLLLIGVGLALIANLHMPNVEGNIEENKKLVDGNIKKILKKLSEILTETNDDGVDELFNVLSTSIKQGEIYAKNQVENNLLSNDVYHISYFQMRRMQYQVLEDMYLLINQIEIETDVAMGVTDLMTVIFETYSEDNDGIILKEKVAEVYREYEQKPLPKTRSEFENRARLYQLLTEIQTFIEIKVNFSQST